MIEGAIEPEVYCRKNRGGGGSKQTKTNRKRRRVSSLADREATPRGAAAASDARVAAFGTAFNTFDVAGFGLVQEAGRGDAHGTAAGSGSTGTAGSSGTSDTVTSVRSRGRWKNRLRLLQLLLLHSHSNFFVLQQAHGGALGGAGPPPAAQQQWKFFFLTWFF